MVRRLLIAFCLILLPLNAVSAHYLWMAFPAKSGDAVHLFFEGGPAAGDGQYLGPFETRGKAWYRSPDHKKPAELKSEPASQGDRRWLTAKLPESVEKDGSRAVEGYGKWGVYRYGKTDVLLHYYARTLQVATSGELKALATASHLRLDMQPRWDGETLQVRVLWDKQPVSGRAVQIRGPGTNLNPKTDKLGWVEFPVAKAGRHTCHVFVEEKQEGEFEGKTYQLVRHHGTLNIRLPLEPVADPDPQRFAKSMAAFANQDKQQPTKPGGIVFVGSSSIRLWDLPKSFGNLDAINRGFGGSQISDVNHFIESTVLQYKPRQVVFFCGGNDLAHGKSPSQVAGDFAAFRKRLFETVPKASLVVVAIKPSLARWSLDNKIRATNQLIAEQAAVDDRIEFLDQAYQQLLDKDGAVRAELFVKDGLHLSPAGYEVWSKLVEAKLQRK